MIRALGIGPVFGESFQKYAEAEHSRGKSSCKICDAAARVGRKSLRAETVTHVPGIDPAGHLDTAQPRLEEEVRQLGRARGPRAAPDARRERAAEATRRGPDAGQANPPEGDPNKSVKPARRRELAQWVQDRHQVSCRRACALARICPNTWYYKGDRSVESRECSDGDQCRADRAERRRRPGGAVHASPTTEGDHGRSRHGVTSKALDEWAYRRGVQLDFIRPGKPVENAFIESFNGRLRDECWNVYSFESIGHAQRLIESWRRDYNDHRPHGALGRLTPSEYATQGQNHDAEAAEL